MRAIGMVTVTGRGNKITGAAAARGLKTTVTTTKGEILLVSLSDRTDLAVDINLRPLRIRQAVISILQGSKAPLVRYIRRLDSQLRVIASVVSLTPVRVRLLSETDQRGVLSQTLQRTEKRCSCVLVSYPPRLSVLAVGTLSYTSKIIVPIGASCLTCQKLARLRSDVRRVRRLVGPRLGILKIVTALCSAEINSSRSVLSLLRGRCGLLNIVGQLTITGGKVCSNLTTMRRTPDDRLTGRCITVTGVVVSNERGERRRRRRWTKKTKRPRRVHCH